MSDDRKDCCKQVDNLETQPSEKPELEIRKCKVCGCRHFELSLEPGVFGIEGKNLQKGVLRCHRFIGSICTSIWVI